MHLADTAALMFVGVFIISSVIIDEDIVLDGLSWLVEFL